MVSTYLDPAGIRYHESPKKLRHVQRSIHGGPISNQSMIKPSKKEVHHQHLMIKINKKIKDKALSLKTKNTTIL